MFDLNIRPLIGHGTSAKYFVWHWRFI